MIIISSLKDYGGGWAHSELLIGENSVKRLKFFMSRSRIKRVELNYMGQSDDSSLAPPDLSFESLKKHNQHDVEYWSARDLQPCLGYSQWRRFESAIEKAMESCKQSGNNPKTILPAPAKWSESEVKQIDG
jgi:hypothetical protein